MMKKAKKKTPSRRTTCHSKNANYTYSNDETIYNSKQIDSICMDLPIVKKRLGCEYINAPFAFDIETSSFYDGELKTAIMYAYVLSIVGKTIIGRNWEDFFACIKFLKNRYQISKDRRLVIYVHNLAFEFSFIQKRFEWLEVFCNDERKPIYAVTTDGIEFRCSYYLSGYSLATVGKNLIRYPIKKMEGDLDYSKLRTPLTPLTDKELKYIQNDGLVVTSYIQETLEKDGNITKIPLTKTGYVRNYCRKMCFYGGVANHKKKGVYKVYEKYRRFIEGMTIDGVEEYQQLKRAFHGGFTHASPAHSGLVRENVASYDFTSSYPAVMCSEMFPMSKGSIVKVNNREDFDFFCKYYCCIFDVEFNNIHAITLSDNPISISKCYIKSDVESDNGRLVSATKIVTTMTNVDFSYLHHFYSWESMRVTNFRIYKKAYLPRNFLLAILNLYKGKTELKGVEGMEEEYMKSKEWVNATFGMSVTDICRDEIVYNQGEWTTESADPSELIEKYNKSKKRFLCYQWGIFITAYAQRNLFTGIIDCIIKNDEGEEIGCDYIYADTDSLKILNVENHLDYIENYNKTIRKKLLRMCKDRKIDPAMCHPFTKDGKEKWLGVWDYEGKYSYFKTLGAKRYLMKKDNQYFLTVAGLNKKKAVPYLYSLAIMTNKSPFESFAENLYVPPEFTGKNTHTYIDDEMEGDCIDYLGQPYHYYEKSGCHLEGCDYTLSLAVDYIKYLQGIRRV